MKNEFKRLKKKIFLQVVLIALVTAALGLFISYLLIDGMLQDPFAEGFIYLCENVLNIDSRSTDNIYQQLFRNQKTILMTIGFFVLLLIVFYNAMTRFARYFNEISDGMDKLTEESEQAILLCPELDFMEKKLNTVKNTLEKRKKDALESEQRKNDLVVYLAHDIKTPLTSVIAYLSLLDEAPDMLAEQKAKYVGITLEKAYRLEQLINEFFEITRFNLQTIVLNKEEINLTFMLMQMADEFYPMLAPQGKKVEVNAEESLKIHGDADKLARVFNNILKNAVAYSHENSTIQIVAKQQEDIVVITFTNQGKAIPKSKLDTIFEKFYRLDAARSTNVGGSGLGLAIAKEIVSAHGGTILAESNELFTIFMITLPLNT